MIVVKCVALLLAVLGNSVVHGQGYGTTTPTTTTTASPSTTTSPKPVSSSTNSTGEYEKLDSMFRSAAAIASTPTKDRLEKLKYEQEQGIRECHLREDCVNMGRCAAQDNNCDCVSGVCKQNTAFTSGNNECSTAWDCQNQRKCPIQDTSCDCIGGKCFNPVPGDTKNPWYPSPPSSTWNSQQGGNSWNSQQGGNSWNSQQGGNSWNSQQKPTSSWDSSSGGGGNSMYNIPPPPPGFGSPAGPDMPYPGFQGGSTWSSGGPSSLPKKYSYNKGPEMWADDAYDGNALYSMYSKGQPMKGGPRNPYCPNECNLAAFPKCTCINPALYTNDGRGNCNVGASKVDLRVWCYLDPAMGDPNLVCPDAIPSKTTKDKSGRQMYWSRVACITE